MASAREPSSAGGPSTIGLGSDGLLSRRAPTRPMRTLRRVTELRPALSLTLAAWVPSLLWFAALQPGLMSADSLAVWQQATDGPWVDLHPPAYTAAMWVSGAVIGSPALLTLAQSLFLVYAIISVALASDRAGANRTLNGVLTAVVVCSPMLGAFAISLWKDIPFAEHFCSWARDYRPRPCALVGDRGARQISALLRRHRVGSCRLPFPPERRPSRWRCLPHHCSLFPGLRLRALGGFVLCCAIVLLTKIVLFPSSMSERRLRTTR